MTIQATLEHSSRVSSRPLPGTRHSGVRLGSLPANSDEDFRFVQDRIALFARTMFFISGMFLAVQSVVDLAAGRERSAVALASHFAGTALALVAWRVARGKTLLTAAVLQALDVAATLGPSWAFAAMGHHSPQPYGAFTALLAVTHVSISRAIVVPSIPRRTVWLAAASFGAVVLSCTVVPLPPEMLRAGVTQMRGVLVAVQWSIGGIAIAFIASKVIYGLQVIAREARQLGQYSLEEKIGEGGMGAVYRARHAMLRRPTAVKLLSGDGTEAELHRFEKEVQLTARLTHPNTISIYDYGRTPDGVFYYAMELLDGLTLQALVEKEGLLPAGRAIHVLRQVCAALKEAHHVGLIHRDIKPANIHLCRRGDIPDFVKVLDFGLVREVKDGAVATKSNVNAIVGTPIFMSPEAILTPDTIDARADIYGLGCVAYYLVTGVPPFTGESLVEVAAHHLHSTPEPPSQRRSLASDLEGVILSCLAKDRADRPASADALGRLLGGCQDAKSWTESDAAAWWERFLELERVKPAKPTCAPDTRHRTIACDFERRLRSDP
jgi:hypothetical protein